MQLQFLTGPYAAILVSSLSACGGSVDVASVGLAAPLAVAGTAPSGPAASPTIDERVLACLHCAP